MIFSELIYVVFDQSEYFFFRINLRQMSLNTP